MKTNTIKKYTLIRLGKYLYEYKLLLFTAIFLTIVSNLFSLVGPLLSGYAIDSIQFGIGKVEFQKVFFLCFSNDIILHIVINFIIYIIYFNDFINTKNSF